MITLGFTLILGSVAGLLWRVWRGGDITRYSDATLWDIKKTVDAEWQRRRIENGGIK